MTTSMPGGSEGFSQSGRRADNERVAPVRRPAATVVTSRRLGADAPVVNRWFPKVRSWLALGAPLELISALSLLRVSFASAVAASGAALVQRPHGAGLAAVLAATTVSGAATLGLLRTAHVGLRWSAALQAGLGLGVLGVVAAGQPTAVGAAFVGVLAVGLAHAALFLRARAVVASCAALAAATALAAWRTSGGVRGAGEVAVLSAVVVAAAGSLTGLLALVCRSARARATVDAETGLPNSEGLANLPPTGAEAFVVAAVHLGGLQEVREAVGHAAGVELLRRAVEDLGQVLPVGCTLGRLDTNLLGIVQPVAAARPAGDGLPAAARRSAERLAGVVLGTLGAARYLVGGIEVVLAGRVGAALGPWDGGTTADLLRRAAHAAQHAIGSGRQLRMWDAARDALGADDLRLLADLRLAVEREQLWLAYQPQWSARTGRISGVEALLRWDHPERGAVPPGRFVPLAERTGAIGALTEWSLGEALDAQVRWRRAGIELPVAVNLSARELARPDLAGWILGELAARDLPPAVLTVEITETAAAAVDVADVVAVLEPLKASGARISIDDFGTGFTSLSVLPLLPLDELKVDLGFVLRSGSSPADDAIVRSVCELARRMGLRAVAEGVEDAEVAARMAAYGYDELQGFHLGRPLPEDALLAEAAAGRRAELRA